MTINYNLKSAERKPLVAATSEILVTAAEYLGVKGDYGYQIGDYHIDRNGVLTGPDNRELVTALRNMGLNPETTVYDTEENEISINRVESDSTTIEIPLGEFTPAKIENLRRMIAAKEYLLKTAMGTEELLIQVTADMVRFPWFNWILDGTEFEAYATFISQLCKTAIAKTRVTATARVIEGSEKYAMRCFMLSLGMIGPEFQNSRRTILAKFEGDSSWKNGKPEKDAAAE